MITDITLSITNCNFCENLIYQSKCVVTLVQQTVGRHSWEKKKNEKHHTEYRKNNNAVNYVCKYRIRFVVV
jgi:hypothetical protein